MTPEQMRKLTQKGKKRAAARERQQRQKRLREEEEKAAELEAFAKKRWPLVEKDMKKAARGGDSSFVGSFFDEDQAVAVANLAREKGFHVIVSDRISSRDPDYSLDEWRVTISWEKKR